MRRLGSPSSRQALEEVGYLDAALNWCMDWDLWIRIGRRFPAVYLPLLLAQVRLHPGTKTSHGGPGKLREMAGIVRKYRDRRFPPVPVVHGGGTLYRGGRRWLGRLPAPWGLAAFGRPEAPAARWIERLVDRVVATGRLPWEPWANATLARPRHPDGVPGPAPPARSGAG